MKSSLNSKTTIFLFQRKSDFGIVKGLVLSFLIPELAVFFQFLRRRDLHSRNLVCYVNIGKMQHSMEILYVTSNSQIKLHFVE